MKQLLVLTFSSLFCAFSALAQQQPHTISDEIIVTASALPERVDETPASATVITRHEIDSRAAHDVADVLREVPGLTVARTGTSGHQTSLFTRGASPAHTLVMWNGIEINMPFFGGYDWGQFSTSGVEQIEVVRGPYSALYGSDAMAGVVNILTIPSRSGISGTIEAGGNDFRNAQLSAAHVNGGLSVSGAFETRTDGGFAENDDFDQRTANASVRWTAPHALIVSAAARYTRYELGIPANLNGDASALVPSPDRRQNGNERQLAVPVSQTLGAFNYELLLAENRREDFLADPGDPWGLTSQKTTALTRRARLTTRTQTRVGTFVAGAEQERTTVDDVTNFGPNFLDRKRRERSLFAENRYSRTLRGNARLELSAGVRLDDYETFGSETSPRIAIAWAAAGNKVRAAYGEAFRAPSVGEMYSPYGGNPDLRAERSRSAEIGFDHYFNDGVVSLSLFQDRYRDLITNDNFKLANVGRARMRGAELSAQKRVSTFVSAGFSYTYLDAKQLDTGEQLLRRPRHSGSVYLTLTEGATEVNLVVLRTGVRDDILPVMPFNRTTNEAHTTADLNVQVHLGRITPYAKLENLTNARYEEVLGYPSPSRRAIVGLRFVM